MGFNTGFIDGTTDLGQKTSLLNRLPFLEGQLWMTGTNDYILGAGALGDNTTTNKSSPVQTSTGGINWKQLSLNLSVAGIKTDGTLWTWGSNSSGQLGISSIAAKSTPTQVAGTTWKQVSASSTTMAAVKSDGTLWTWGDNSFGQLGIGSIVSKSSPNQVPGTTWKQVSAYQYHMAAIKTDGTLWTWGLNSAYQLGIPTATAATSSPVQTVTGGSDWKQVMCSNDCTRALKTDGTFWFWGNNLTGEGGDNPGFAKTSPVQTNSGTWKILAEGTANRTLAIATDDTLWGWGYNGVGNLADGTTDNKSSPVQILGGGSWIAVGDGKGIKDDGTLWSWGPNSSGAMGDGTTVPKSSPVQIMTGYKFINTFGNPSISGFITDNS